MIDIHSHVLFGVDDGPTNMEESIKMVSEASKAGIKVIITTPHYHKEIFENDKILENFNKLKTYISGFDITLLLGYEVFINPSLPGMIESRRPLTMNNSGYMLLELPFDNIPIYTYDTIYKLQLLNVTPVIAHPERNRNFVKDFDIFLALVERGCLVQLDAASIIGTYGRKVKEFTKRLIKLNLAHFVASDAHCSRDYINWYSEAYKTVKSWAGEEYTDKLFTKNATAILENIKESVYEMI